MKAHISSVNAEEQITQAITESFKKTRSSYITAGAKAMCTVILEKAQDESKTADERLAEIVKFCETNLKGIEDSERDKNI